MSIALNCARDGQNALPRRRQDLNKLVTHNVLYEQALYLDLGQTVGLAVLL